MDVEPPHRANTNSYHDEKPPHLPAHLHLPLIFVINIDQPPPPWEWRKAEGRGVWRNVASMIFSCCLDDFFPRWLGCLGDSFFYVGTHILASMTHGCLHDSWCFNDSSDPQTTHFITKFFTALHWISFALHHHDHDETASIASLCNRNDCHGCHQRQW